MPKTKGKELTIGEKVRVIQDHEEEKSFRQIALLYGIGKSSAERKAVSVEIGARSKAIKRSRNAQHTQRMHRNLIN